MTDSPARVLVVERLTASYRQGYQCGHEDTVEGRYAIDGRCEDYPSEDGEREADDLLAALLARVAEEDARLPEGWAHHESSHGVHCYQHEHCPEYPAERKFISICRGSVTGIHGGPTADEIAACARHAARRSEGRDNTNG